MTYNSRGLNDHSKQRKLFIWLESQNYDIVLLQETYCTIKLEPYLKASWSGDIINAKSESGHSKGVSVLFRKGFQGNILKSYDSDDGRVLIISVELNNELLHITSVHAPNIEPERIVFYENLSKFCVKHCDNLNNIIVVGNLNICSKVTDRYPKSNKMD